MVKRIARQGQSFQDLRQGYVGRLIEMKACIEEWQAELQSGTLTADLLLAMKNRTHWLAGSGGTYGFHHVSAAAFAAEDAAGRALVGSPNADLLYLALHSLANALEDAKLIAHAPRSKNGGLWGSNISFLKPRRHKHRGRIVIIEDDPDIAELLSTELFRRGFDVEIARDGIAAVATIWNKRPDLVILERGLPLMAGASVFTELKQYKATRDIPVVVLSSLPHSALFDAPATIYHSKPFDTEELMDVCIDLALQL